MFCMQCGKEQPETNSYCEHCGAPLKNTMNLNREQTMRISKNSQQNNQQQIVYQVPPEYKPIGMWGYFGFSIVFNIPFIGWLIALILALGAGSNINVRNYARSFFLYSHRHHHIDFILI